MKGRKRKIYIAALSLIVGILLTVCMFTFVSQKNYSKANAESTSESKYESITGWGGTQLNGATVLPEKNWYLSTNVYETADNGGYEISSGVRRNVLSGGQFVKFYIDTLGDGGEVLKGARSYGGYNSYGFVAGSGEPVYRTDKDGNEVLAGYNSVAIKLKYNYQSLEGLRAYDGHYWNISDDGWKQTVNGMKSIGPIGKGAVIVQKFVPSEDKKYPTQKSDWKRLNEFSDKETDGLHTVNFFDEYKPSEKKEPFTVYQPDGEDLKKGVFVKLTVVYELVRSERKTGLDKFEGWWSGESKNYYYKNVVEETTFYLCDTSGEIVFENSHYSFDDGSKPDEEAKPVESNVEKKVGQIIENQGSSEGFRLDLRCESYDVRYYLNNSSNAMSCRDGQLFNMPGKYEFVVTTKIGVVRRKTVYIHESTNKKNIEAYFGDSLIADGAKRVFSPSDQYPVYVKGTVKLETQDENRLITKHAPLVGKVFLISDNWDKVDREKGLPKEKLVNEKTADEKNWKYSDLEPGKYEAVFANNADYFNGTASGDTYVFVWRFTIIESGQTPIVNGELLYQQIGVSDYASKHYEVAVPSKNENSTGKILVCFTNETDAYNFASKYLVSEVKHSNGKYIFDGKEYATEREMLTDLHKKARSMPVVRYFDLTDESTFLTLKNNIVKPDEPDENSTDDERKYYENFVSILNMNLKSDVLVFSESFYESAAVGEPFLNDRIHKSYDVENDKIDPVNKNSVYFVSFGDFESSSVTLYYESGNKDAEQKYEIPFGVAVENYLESKNAPTGRYKIVETNETGSATYYGIYVRKGELTTTLSLQRNLNNDETSHNLNIESAELRLRANNVILKKAVNAYDPYGIVKILKDGKVTAIYQLDEINDVIIDEEGKYEIIVVDRLGNSARYYVDIYSASKVYTFTLKNGDKTIFTDYAFGGKTFELERLQSESEDYEFAGWQDENGNVYNDVYVFNTPDDIVLTALWHNTKVEISVFNGTQIQTYYKKVGDKQVLPKLSKEGYTLYGYQYVQPDGTIRFYKGQINSIPNVKSMRIDAVWTKNTSVIEVKPEAEDTVIVSLIDGTLVDAITVQKGSPIELPQLQNENGMIFGGWLYQYKLAGTIFTAQFSLDEIAIIGTDDATAVKLTAIWLADPNAPTTPVAAGTISNAGGSGNIFSAIGGFVAGHAYSFGFAAFCLLLLAVICFNRKRIANAISTVRQKCAVKKQAAAAQGAANGNIVFADNVQEKTSIKKAARHRARAVFGAHRGFYAGILVPCIILVLCLTMLLESQHNLLSGISYGIHTAHAESRTELLVDDGEEDGRTESIISAYGSIEKSYDIKRQTKTVQNAYAATNTEEKQLTDSETFLYSNVLVDLLSMGFKDVFTAYAVADGKVVSGLGYTSYVDAYEENGKYIFGAGFVSLADKNHITQADVEKGVKIIVDESESDYYEYTEFKLTFNQNWGPLHYVAYKQYVHYQVADYIVQNSITPDNGQYIDAYGDVYDYDIGDTCHYVNYGGDFELNAYGLTSKVDYDNIVETYVQIIQEQTKNLVDVQVEKADFISVQALNDYLAHNQREEFLGIDADTILYYEANTADTQYYIIRENGEVEVLNLPPDPVKKASIFQRIATGIAAISGAVLGAVLCALPGAGPIVGGALLSASIDVFMQVTVCGTAPENIDWLSVATSAVVGGITGGMGMVSNAIVKNVAASGIKALLVKVGTQTLTGMFSGGVAYLLNATVRGEDVDFFDCMKSMCVGGLTGALTGLCSTALQSITTEANGLMVALQVISGGLSGGVSYMLSIAITGDEFSWQAFAMSVGMGAVTAAVTVVGEKIVKTVQVKKFERVEKAQKARNEQAKELGIIDDSPLTPQELAELKKTINKYITSDDNKNWKLVDKNGQPLTKNQLMDNPTQEAYLVSTDKSGYVDANGNKFKLPVVRGHVDQGALAVDNVYAKGGIYAKRQATFDMFDELLADKWSAPGAKVPDDFKAYFKSQPLINDDLSNLKWQDIAKARAGNALGYSWHEDPDLHTGYLIKTEMHTSIKHQGGHSIINNLIKSQDISKTRTDLYNEIIAQHKGGK